MKSELRGLYQDVIVEHSKRPRNFRALGGGARVAQSHNPLCGDTVTVYVDVEGEALREVTFQGIGCAICTASASVMTEMVTGKSQTETARLCAAFHDVVTEALEATASAELGVLTAFAGVRRFPSRVKCAELPWRTLQAALRAGAPATG